MWITCYDHTYMFTTRSPKASGFAERDPVYSVRSASKVRRWPTIETRAHTTIKTMVSEKGTEPHRFHTLDS